MYFNTTTGTLANRFPAVRKEKSARLGMSRCVNEKIRHTFFRHRKHVPPKHWSATAASEGDFLSPWNLLADFLILVHQHPVDNFIHKRAGGTVSLSEISLQPMRVPLRAPRRPAPGRCRHDGNGWPAVGICRGRICRVGICRVGICRVGICRVGI
jgi:hypothetical protein